MEHASRWYRGCAPALLAGTQRAALTGWDACQTALNVLPTAFGEQVLWPNAVDAGAWTTLVDCSQATGGYVPGDATNPSTTCPAGCILTPAVTGGSDESCVVADQGAVCQALKCSYSPPPAPAIVIAPVSRVCGDGKRTSNEPCDDANLVDGDGCSAQCTIESGFVCPFNQLLKTSQCEQPDRALVSFNISSLTASVDEGADVTLTIARSGDPRSCTPTPGWYPEGSCTAKTGVTCRSADLPIVRW